MVRRRQYVFNEVAALYDEMRPGYRPAIVDAVAACLPAGGRILEIGCGTGQMTRPLARRGYSILALEPGAEMAALAARNCRDYPLVKVHISSFEDWPADGHAFDMVISAMAFHWIAPDAGCAKAASVLRSGGVVALAWHIDVSQCTPFWQASEPIYDAYFHPPEGHTTMISPGERAAVCAEAIRRCGAFEPVEEVRHGWEETYRDGAYLRLLQTYSDHRTLPEPGRTRFFKAIEEVAERFGGVVSRRYETLLLLARRR